MAGVFFALVADLVVRLYPADFRDRFRDDVIQAASWQVARRRKKCGRASALWRAIRELGALLDGIPAAWLDRWRRRLRAPAEPGGRGPLWNSGLGASLRGLTRRPGYAAIVVVTLAFGIGSTTAMFTVINGVVLRPLSFDGADRLNLVWNRFEWIDDGQETWVHDLQVRALREEATAFEDFAAMGMVSGRILGGDQPVHADVARVSANFFDMLGVKPILGRTFQQGEDVWRSPWVVLITHGFWTRHFGQDSSVIGKKLVVGFPEMEIIGVLPAGFDYRLYEALGQSTSPELWIPHMIDYGWWPRAAPGQGVAVLSKVKEGIDPAAARADLARLAALHGDRFYERDGLHYSLTSLKDDVVAGVRGPLAILLAAVGMVLLIAVANLATLSVARTHRRGGELAVRHALGASSGTLARQLIAEQATLAIVGGALGVLLARGLIDLLLVAAPVDLPRADAVSLDLSALLFATAVVFVAGLLPGLVPALGIRSTRLAERISSGRVTEGSGARRVRHLLVVAQVALSMVLVVGSGLLMRSLVMLNDVDPGYRTDSTLTFSVFLMQEYQTADDRDRFFATLSDRVAELPGVSAVGVTTTLPLSTPSFGPVFFDPPADSIDYDLWPGQGVEPDPSIHPPTAWVMSDIQVVRPGYFETLDIGVMAGRPFGGATESETGEIVIDETLARSRWPDGDAVGQTVWILNIPVTVSAVVRHTHQHRLGMPGRPQVYIPYDWVGRTLRTSMLVRASDPLGLVPQIRQAVAELDPIVPIADIRLLDDIVAQETAVQRFILRVMGAFAAAGLALAALGLYGVLSFAVTERRREIAVRVAVGARRPQVACLVMGHALRLVATGLVLGSAGALVLGRVLSSRLFGISWADPVSLVAAAAGLLAIGLVGAWFPARRALATDPVETLRWE